MENCQLLTRTRELLKNRTKSLRAISEESGINYHWLGKFQQGAFDDPGVKKVEQLHDFLVSAQS